MTNYWVRQDMILPPMLKKNIAIEMVYLAGVVALVF